MVVVIAKAIPNQVRGKLKLWFVEVAPYVFVSGVKDFCAEKISRPPYYKVTEKRFTQDEFLSICGIKLKVKRQKAK